MAIPIEKDIKILSERGTNKSLVPTPKDAPLPYKWEDKEGRKEAYVIDKKWGAENFMVMDVIAHLLVRKLREKTPESATKRIEFLSNVKMREIEIKNHEKPLKNEMDLPFEVFRKITGKQWMTNRDIFKLLRETSTTSFIISYPMTVVKEVKETKKGTTTTYKEQNVRMSWLTRPFELGWEEEELNEKEGKYPNKCKIKLNTIFFRITHSQSADEDL